jgi:hypothetical protein
MRKESIGCPETSVTTYKPCVTFHMGEDLNLDKYSNVRFRNIHIIYYVTDATATVVFTLAAAPVQSSKPVDPQHVFRGSKGISN